MDLLMILQPDNCQSFFKILNALCIFYFLLSISRWLHPLDVRRGERLNSMSAQWPGGRFYNIRWMKTDAFVLNEPSYIGRPAVSVVSVHATG